MNSVNLFGVSWQCMPECFVNFSISSLRFLEAVATGGIFPPLVSSATAGASRGGQWAV